MFSGEIILQIQDVHILKLIFILLAKLLKTTTDGAASQKSNEIHLKLDNNQLNRISIDTSGLHETWPEFWAIGLSFLGLYFLFCVFHYLASSPTVRGGGRGGQGVLNNVK